MRQMAGYGKDQIMMFGVHDLDIGTKLLPEGLHLLDIGLGGIFGRGQDAPAFVEQGRESGIRTAMLGTGDRVGGDDPRAGKRFGERGQYYFLG